MNQCFRVGLSAKVMSMRDQISTHFLVVVDLTIEDDLQRAILIADRLMP